MPRKDMPLPEVERTKPRRSTFDTPPAGPPPPPPPPPPPGEGEDFDPDNGPQ